MPLFLHRMCLSEIDRNDDWVVAKLLKSKGLNNVIIIK